MTCSTAKAVDIKLQYGIKDNKLVHIYNVDSGLSCNCLCPYCKEQLIARKGDVNMHHFAHVSTVECKYGVQTALHLAAKEILEEQKKFSIPPLLEWIDLSNEKDIYFTENERLIQENKFLIKIIEEKIYEFDKVITETRSGNIIPDIVLLKGDKKLIVEIAVTHFADSKKLEQIKTQKLSAIEINLSSFKNGFTKDDLTIHVVEGHVYKKWINNSRKTELIEKKRRELIQERKVLKIQKEKEIESGKELKERKRKEREARELFYKNYYKKIIRRSTKSKLRLRHIENCKISNRFYEGRQFANVDIDCKSCQYFRGLNETGKFIVCLEDYFQTDKP